MEALAKTKLEPPADMKAMKKHFALRTSKKFVGSGLVEESESESDESGDSHAESEQSEEEAPAKKPKTSHTSIKPSATPTSSSSSFSSLSECPHCLLAAPPRAFCPNALCGLRTNQEFDSAQNMHIRAAREVLHTTTKGLGKRDEEFERLAAQATRTCASATASRSTSSRRARSYRHRDYGPPPSDSLVRLTQSGKWGLRARRRWRKSRPANSPRASAR
jgi:hypothetical protein